MKPQPMTFDPSTIARMADPLSVIVERVNGNQRTPIEMPSSEDGGPGSGWARDSISSMQGWVARTFGGGQLRFTVTDSSEPMLTHTWQYFFPPSEFPVPPPSAVQAAQAQLPPQPMPVPAAPTQYRAVPTASLPPFATAYGDQVAIPQYNRMPVPMSYPPGYFPQPSPTAPIVSAPRDEVEKRALADQNRLLADQLRKAETDRLNDLHAAEMEKIRVENERQLAEMRRAIAAKSEDAAGSQRFSAIENAIAKLTEAVVMPKGPSPEMLALQNKLDMMERERAHATQVDPKVAALEAQLKALADANAKQVDQMQRDRERAEYERREHERANQTDPKMIALEAQLKAMAEQNAKQSEQMQRDRERLDAERRERDLMDRLDQQQAAMQAQLEAIKAKPAGPDPMFLMMIDLMKSNQQQATMAQERMQGMILKPQDIISMSKESSQGLDEMKRSMTGLFTDVFSMQKQVMENAMQMQPQGESAVVRLVEGGMTALKDGIDRYGAGKAAQEMGQQKAQIEAAKAAGEQAKLQQMHLQYMANQEAAARQAAAQGHGLNGAALAQAQVPQTTPVTEVNGAAKPTIEFVDATAPNVAAAVAAAPPVANGDEPKRFGKTDDEWFGVALGEVLKLRDGVFKYLRNVNSKKPKLDPKTHQPLGIAPEQAAYAVVEASKQISAIGADVLAYAHFFRERRMDEFMEVLLPEVDYRYRSDVARLVMEALRGIPVPGGEPDEDEEEEDDENVVPGEEDDDNGEPAHA